MSVLTLDCRHGLPVFPDASFDAVVTDPPYELGFMGKAWDASGIAYNVDLWREVLRVLKPGGHVLAFGGSRTYHRMTCAIEDAGFEVRDSLMWLYGSGYPKSPRLLKPAHEPICMAVKPGAAPFLNIEACRVEGEGAEAGRTRHGGGGAGGVYAQDEWTRKNMATMGVGKETPAGRWPANVLHDGSAEVLEGFPVNAGARAPVKGTEPSDVAPNGITNPRARVPGVFHADTGSAARFFYCAKASKSDRGEGNTHPTVKPSALMQYLCRLVTPPGGLILDPFTGSGSTGVAAKREGFQFMGFELSEEYAAIARRRIAGAV